MSTNCIFCKIIEKKENADIKLENDELIIFKDIKPASTYHFLSVPKEHIKDVNCLTADHKHFLERLITEGKNVMQNEGGDLNDLLMGFHLPPFNTVKHLHLHLISPASKMGIFARIMFKINSYWFATEEQILQRLSKL